MKFLILSIFVLMQADATLRETGTVTGQVRYVDGTAPDIAIRVAAMEVADQSTDQDVFGTLVSITQTNASGRFKLESVPPGRYYIVAGFIEAPTYYPGVTVRDTAQIFTVAPDDEFTGINFTIERPSEALLGKRPVTVINGLAATEAGEPVPHSMMSVILESTVNGKTFTVSTGVTASGRLRFFLNRGEYRITVSGFPFNYAVESISYGTQDLLKDPLMIDGSLPAQNLRITLRKLDIGNSYKVSGHVDNLPSTVWLERPSVRLRLGLQNQVISVGPSNVSDRFVEAPISPDGTFRFEAVPPGSYKLDLRGFDFAVNYRSTVEVLNDDVSGVVIELP